MAFLAYVRRACGTKRPVWTSSGRSETLGIPAHQHPRHAQTLKQARPASLAVGKALASTGAERTKRREHPRAAKTKPNPKSPGGLRALDIGDGIHANGPPIEFAHALAPADKLPTAAQPVRDELALVTVTARDLCMLPAETKRYTAPPRPRVTIPASPAQGRSSIE